MNKPTKEVMGGGQCASRMVCSSRQSGKRELNKKFKIKKDVVVRWYVEENGEIYGGPFYTLEEAKECLKEAQVKIWVTGE